MNELIKNFALGFIILSIIGIIFLGFWTINPILIPVLFMILFLAPFCIAVGMLAREFL